MKKEKQQKQPVTIQGKFAFFRENRNEIFLISGLYLLIYLLIGWLYPDPYTYSDSSNYILSAIQQKYGGYRPYGYSWFLRFVHSFSAKPGAVFTFQYLFNYIAMLVFFLSVKRIFPARNKWLSYGLLLLAGLSPATLYMTNYIMSDSLFLSLTLLWLSTLLWIIYNNSIAAIVLHAIVLYFVLMVRFSGIFYPVISIVAFILAFPRQRKYLSLLAVIPVVISWRYYSDMESQMKKLVNVKVFSAFGGWQSANNALIISPYVDLKPEALPDNDLKEIHTMVKSYPDSVYRSKGLTIAYLWDKDMPLKQYMFSQMQSRNMYYLQAFAFCGQKYGKYGSYILTHYPGQYFTHFMIPNTGQLLYPSPLSVEILNEFSKIAPSKDWFEVEGNEYRSPVYDLYYKVFTPLAAPLNLLFWVLSLGAIIVGIIKRKQVQLDSRQWNVFYSLLAFMLVYAGFLVFSAPFAFRYILPLHCLQVALPYMLLNAYRGSNAAAAPVKS